MGDIGLEVPSKNTGKTALLEEGGAESGAVGAGEDGTSEGLRKVIDAWPYLSEETREQVVRFVTSQPRLGRPGDAGEEPPGP